MPDSAPVPNIGRGVLQAIFAVFLGLMVTAVVGVGVYTFHPNPAQAVNDQVEALYDQRAQVDGCNSPTPGQCRDWDELTAAEQGQVKAIDAQIADLQRTAAEQQSQWQQTTSVTLIVLATLLMALSLALGDSVSVLSNGILLGGLFTMLYGVGWGLASGSSLTRFLVLVAALGVSLALGYLKFVRRRRSGAPEGGATAEVVPGEETGAEAAAVVALTARVTALERRLAAAAAGLGDAEATGRDGS